MDVIGLVPKGAGMSALASIPIGRRRALSCLDAEKELFDGERRAALNASCNSAMRFTTSSRRPAGLRQQIWSTLEKPPLPKKVLQSANGIAAGGSQA